MELLKPYLGPILEALLPVFLLYLVGVLQLARKKAEAWLVANTNDKQREILQKIGQEAFAHAETIFKGMGGQKKLDEAYGYAVQKLLGLGVVMTQEEIQAAIHKAWLEYQAQVNAGSLKEPSTSSEMKPF